MSGGAKFSLTFQIQFPYLGTKVQDQVFPLWIQSHTIAGVNLLHQGSHYIFDMHQAFEKKLGHDHIH